MCLDGLKDNMGMPFSMHTWTIWKLITILESDTFLDGLKGNMGMPLFICTVVTDKDG